MNINLLIRVPFIILVCIFTNTSLLSQSNPLCNCTVNAGQDKQLCEPGGATQLNGSSTGNPLSYNWTPVSGLSNSKIKNPTATVNQTTTYTLTIECLSNTNIVDNADFQQGNSGFSSDYTYEDNDLVPEGLYTVTTNPQLVHAGFAPCSDHTGGGGNMMVVNGAGTPGLNVWCQTIPVQPNTDYAFETWVATVVAASPALLQFSINGNTIGPIFQAPGSNCQWVQFTATWNSGSSNFATICIVNQNTQLGGNDFALDDISFKEICKFEDEVTIYVNPIQKTDIQASICQGQTYKVGTQTFSNEGTYNVKLKTWKNCDSIVTLDLTVIEVIAQIEPPDNLDCGLTEITLHGEQSSFGPEYSYKWTTTNGHMVSDPTKWEVIVDKPGTYKLTVTYNDGIIICSQVATVTVVTDFKKPKLNAGNDGQLTCNDTLLTLHGKPIDPIDNFKVKWITPNGKIVSKADTLDPTIGSPGMYIMQLTSNYNGCIAYDTVFVTTDSSLPLAVINGPDILNCYNSIIWLDGTKSNSGTGYSFQWNSVGGKIDSKTDSLKVQISTPGVYTLAITDLATGCKTISKITIASDFLYPLADAGNTDTLSCQSQYLDLIGSSGIPDSTAIYFWSTIQGKILSGKDSLSAKIGSPGMYYFRVQNKVNGCTSIDSVFIEKDINLPTALAGINDTLSCIKIIADLNANGSSTGSEYTYDWTALSGNLTGSNTGLITTADEPGVYVFTVFNQLNGCKSSDTVEVFKDITPPLASAGPNLVITCKDPIVILDGLSSSFGSEFKYLWSTVNGNIITNANEIEPEIDQPGIYYIEVTNILNGCVSVDSVEIFENKTPPDITVVPLGEITCKDPETTLLAVNQSSSGSYTYLWSSLSGTIISGGNSLTPLVGKEGIYTLISTNNINGCTDIDEVTISNSSELPEVDAGTDTVLSCKNTILSLSGSIKYTGQDLLISWSSPVNPILSGENTLTPEINKSGLYILTAIDTLTGCKGEDNIVVGLDTLTPKTSILLPEKLSCKLTSTQLSLKDNAPEWSYVWSTQNGNISSGLNTSSATVNKAGNYQVEITDTENGCSSIINVQLFEDKLPPSLDAGPPQLITCTKLKVKLNAIVTSPTSNLSYYWAINGIPIPNSNTLNPEIDLSGTYELIVTNEENGCTASDTTSVNKNSNIPVSLQADVIPPGCIQLGSVSVNSIIGGDAPYQYALNGGSFQTGNSFSSLNPGTYKVLIKDKNGCLLEDDFVVPEPGTFEVDLPSDITIEYGSDQQLHPVLNIPVNLVQTVDWKPLEGLSCSDCMEPFANPVNTTVYTIFVTDKTGCTSTAKLRIFVVKDFGLYIPNVFSPNADGINDIWHVFGDLKKVTRINELRIFDRWGELMFEDFDFLPNDPLHGWNGKFKGRYLNPAVFVYYLEAEFADKSTKLYKGDINLVR